MFATETVFVAGELPCGVEKLNETGETCIVAGDWLVNVYVPPLLKPGTERSWPSSSP
jgi:hypothetical protein